MKLKLAFLTVATVLAATACAVMAVSQNRLERELAACRAQTASAQADAQSARFLWQNAKATLGRCSANETLLQSQLRAASARSLVIPKPAAPPAPAAENDYTVIVAPAPLTPGRQLVADAARAKYPMLAGLASQLLRSTESSRQQAAYQPVYALRGRVPVSAFTGSTGAMFWFYDAAAKTWSGPFPAGKLP